MCFNKCLVSLQVASGAAVAAATSILADGAAAAPVLAAGTTSKSGYDLTPMSQQEVEENAKAFNDLQKRVSALLLHLVAHVQDALYALKHCQHLWYHGFSPTTAKCLI
jgi:hypothetical protein